MGRCRSKKVLLSLSPCLSIALRAMWTLSNLPEINNLFSRPESLDIEEKSKSEK